MKTKLDKVIHNVKMKSRAIISICGILVVVFAGCSGQVGYGDKSSLETTNNSQNISGKDDTKESIGNIVDEQGKENQENSANEKEQQNTVDIEQNSTNANQQITNETENKSLSNQETENITLDLVMVGDVLLHTPIEEGAVQDDGSYDFHHLFAQVKDTVQESDLALVNQEVILGGSDLGISGYPAFNGPFEVADALVDTGFDVVLHGTNHALDKGEKGILSCLQNWKSKYLDIAVLGIHDSDEDSKDIYYTEQKGMKLAILNYTYGTNGISVPAGKDYLVDYLSESKVRDDIREAEANADFTIVCPHWGTEYEHGISSEQKKWTQIFLEEGVDLVIGTHPHVIEPIEWVENEDHSMLVYYSLGNFINCTSGSGAGVADRMVGGMAEVTLGRDADTDEVEIQTFGVEPLVTQMAYGQNEITTYFLKDYSQNLAEQNAVCEKDSKFSYEYCVSLCDNVFNDVWREKVPNSK